MRHQTALMERSDYTGAAFLDGKPVDVTRWMLRMHRAALLVGFRLYAPWPSAQFHSVLVRDWEQLLTPVPAALLDPFAGPREASDIIMEPARPGDVITASVSGLPANCAVFVVLQMVPPDRVLIPREDACSS